MFQLYIVHYALQDRTYLVRYHRLWNIIVLRGWMRLGHANYSFEFSNFIEDDILLK